MIQRYRFMGEPHSAYPVPVHRIPDSAGEYVRHEHFEHLLDRIREALACVKRGQADKARIELTHALQYATMQEHSE